LRRRRRRRRRRRGSVGRMAGVSAEAALNGRRTNQGKAGRNTRLGVGYHPIAKNEF